MSFAQTSFIVILLLNQFWSEAEAKELIEERTDLNFKAVTNPGRKIPAIPASSLRTFKGSVDVIIDSRTYNLETLTVMPSGSGPYPLAVISHGTPPHSGGVAARRRVRIRGYYSIAEDFARRGYKAVIFARRGYGSSKGTYQEGVPNCRRANENLYVRIARNGAKDYSAIIETLTSQPDVDGSTVVAVGHSGGGFAASALSSQPPSGLIAVISFAGGRGYAPENGSNNCSARGFIGAFGEFGNGARVPALWLYSLTDKYFRPSLVHRSLNAYAQNGAPVRLEQTGALWFTHDGHDIHLLGARELWSPRIDSFLNAIGAPNWEHAPDDVAVSKIPPPSGMTEHGNRHWRRYLGFSGHKAFTRGKWKRRQFGWVASRDTVEQAIKDATKNCEKYGGKCYIVSVDGEMVP